MKRVVVVLLVMGMLLFCGCGSRSVESNNQVAVGDLINVYDSIPNGGILNTDHTSLETLVELMGKTKYRVCGVLNKVEHKENSFLTDFHYYSAYLTVGDKDIHIVNFEENQTPLEGEYVEVVGYLLSVDSTTLKDCVITERGDSVRERIKK